MAETKTGELITRAIAGYARYQDPGEVFCQPDAKLSGVIEIKHPEFGKHVYVRLANAQGILRIFRVMGSGQLKRLKRWPKELDQ